MKILTFAASSSSQSINRALVQHAAARLRAELLSDAEIELIDLNDYEMPIYSADRERDGGVPAPANRFLEKIGAADALMVSYAEHNGSYTAAFKNLFDWASRLEKKVFQGKPMVALSTSPGRNGGARVLGRALESAPHYGTDVVGSLSVPRFGDSFDVERGALVDQRLAEELGRALVKLASRLDPQLAEKPAAAAPGASMWDQRYGDAFTAYGTDPNDFLRAMAGQIPPGPVLVIAAGEGRNAVYLAELGHEVTAMDQSEVGLENAAALAARQGVDLKTTVADLADFDFGTSRWAAIVSVWTHVPPPLRRKMLEACVDALEPGGAFILEGYAPAHLDRPGKGGPPVGQLLFDPKTVRGELGGLDLVLCQQVERDVAEGRFHNGPSTTTQVLGFRRDAQSTAGTPSDTP